MDNADQAEKTEEPTAKRRTEARKDGQIATSRDVAGVAIGAAILLVLVFQGSAAVETIARHFARILASAEQAPQSEAVTLVTAATRDFGRTFVALMWAIAGCAVFVAIAAGLAQTGGNFSTKALEWKWERLAPLEGIKRKVFSGEALQQIGLALGKALVLGAALTWVLLDNRAELVALTQLGLGDAMAYVGRLVLKLVVVALIASAALAALDYALTRRRMNEQLKMTKQEVKDELKQMEGDPQVRGRLRQRMREIGRNQMISATRKADVVVVNPTHYAVALAYKVGQAGAPRLVAKGRDAVAARIREIARRHQVPVVANPPVARAVYKQARIGQEVPPELFAMVARVLAYLYRVSGQRAAA